MTATNRNENAGMFTRTVLPLRERWRRFVSSYAEAARSEYRRQSDRYYPGYGSVTVRFAENGMPVERTGTLQNFSETGMMFKQYKEIEPQTMLQIEIAVGEETFALIGRAVHSTQTLGGYKIGIAFHFDE